MRIRAAVGEDAPALGHLMVTSWLAAHRGQMPEGAWQKRVDEWTPEVSARGWARVLGAQADGTAPRDVLLVAEEDSGSLTAVVYGTPAEGHVSGATAEISGIYVLPDHARQGIGSRLLRAAATELIALGFATIRIEVLTANHPARGFYEAMGGVEIGRRTFNEEGFLLPATVYEWSDPTRLQAR